MIQKKMIPAIEDGMGDRETAAELFDRMQLQQVFCNDPENKEDPTVKTNRKKRAVKNSTLRYRREGMRRK